MTQRNNTKPTQTINQDDDDDYQQQGVNIATSSQQQSTTVASSPESILALARGSFRNSTNGSPDDSLSRIPSLTTLEDKDACVLDFLTTSTATNMRPLDIEGVLDIIDAALAVCNNDEEDDCGFNGL